MSQPTIKDVAKLAGVSVSTVSRVMNDSKPVSAEFRRKVEDAVEKLGFKPNELARSLVMKKSNSVGVIVKDIGIEYMAQIIRGIEEIGKMYKYDILLSSTYGEIKSERQSVDFLFRKQVEGLIVLSEDIDPEIVVKIKEYDIPFIHLDRYYKSNEFHTVTVDYKKAMRKMAEYLIENGHKKIAYVGKESKYEISTQKKEGYLQAIREAGLEPHVYEDEEADTEAGYNLMDEHYAQMKKDGITAVMASADALAVGIISYCYDKGISVPEELSVSGFGNTKISELYRPRITTVDEPYYDIGAVAMRWLTKILRGEDTMDETICLGTQIIERDSTKKIN